MLTARLEGNRLSAFSIEFGPLEFGLIDDMSSSIAPALMSKQVDAEAATALAAIDGAAADVWHLCTQPRRCSNKRGLKIGRACELRSRILAS